MRIQFTLIVWLVGIATSSFAQDEHETNGVLKRYFERVFGQVEDSTTAKLIHYPTLAYAPETSWEFGIFGESGFEKPFERGQVVRLFYLRESIRSVARPFVV